MKKIEFALKNILLRIMLHFNSVNKKNESIKLAPDSNVLFIRLNKIGDALVTTPLIKLIKEKTGCRVTILADRKNHFIFNNPDLYDEIFIFQKGFGAFKKLVKKLNALKFDAVIDLHDDVSTTVSFLIASIHAPVKIGLQKGNENIYTCIVNKLAPDSNHVVSRILEFAKVFDIKYNLENINIHFPLNESSSNKINKFIKSNYNGNFDKKFLAGVNISAGSDARFWGVERFKKIISFLENYDLNILIISTENEKHLADKISDNKYPVFTTPDFNEFAAAVSKLNFLFTPDTSIVHLASAYEIPMFGIYVKYNTPDMIWSPFKSDFDCVITEEPNFKNLDYDQVEEKFKTFFEKIYEQRNTKM